MRIGLVACSQSKAGEPMQARELYRPSALFRKSSRYAELSCVCWFILSAKHGLVHPGEVIEPYEKRMPRRGGEQLRIWRDHVVQQMDGQQLLGQANTFVWLTGQAYSDPLQPVLRGEKHEFPLQGLQIGERLSWLTNQLTYLEKHNDPRSDSEGVAGS